MKQGFKVIDSELHLEEPFDLWERRLEEPYRSWTQVLPRPRGHLQVGGTRYRFGPNAPQETQGDGASLVARQADRRWPDAPHLVEARTQCAPEVYLEGMDIEGIDVAILTPTMGIGIASRDGLDPGHAAALCRAYNTYAGEFAHSNSDRFKFWAWLPRQDATLAARELRRCVEDLGAVGAGVFQGAIDGHLLSDTFFDPLWETLSELGVPIGFHIGAGGAGQIRDDPTARYRGHSRTEITRHSVAQSWAPTTLGELILGGVLERYSGLQVVIMESQVSWLPWLLWRMDEDWETYGPDVDYQLALKPSEYFRRQCCAVLDPDEEPARYVIDYIGDTNLLFSTDYPHHDSLFPVAVDTFLGLDGISQESKRRILWDNGARLYGLKDVADLEAPHARP